MTSQSLSNVRINISQLRKTAGYSQKKFAARVGITNKQLQKLEHGEEEPCMDLALCMSEVLGCTVNDLYVRKVRGPHIKPGRYIDLTGKRFGMLTVIEPLDEDKDFYGTKNRWWLCRCDCGEVVKARGDKLRGGQKTNCGCQAKQRKPGAFPEALGYELALPEGVEHGSVAGVRLGCTCAKCLNRKKRAVKRVS